MLGIKRPDVSYVMLVLILVVLAIVVVGIMHIAVRALGFVMFKLTWIVVLAVLIGAYLWMRKKEPGERE